MGLGAVPASGSEVYLTWTNTATNETGFTLTRATDSLFTQNVVTETLASAPFYYTDGAAGLSPGNTYYYKIQATNSSGLSSSSNTASVSIPNVPPAPTNAAAVQNGNSIVVSWTDHAGPFALGYQISRSVDGGPYAIYADRPETSDAPPTTQTFTDTNVPVGPHLQLRDRGGKRFRFQRLPPTPPRAFSDRPPCPSITPATWSLPFLRAFRTGSASSSRRASTR